MDEKKHRSEWFKATRMVTIAIVLSGLACSLYLHLSYETTLNQSEDLWEKRVDFHRDIPPHSTRMFTTTILDVAHTTLGVDYLTVFSILQYSLSFFLGLAFYSYLRSMGFSVTYSNLGLVLLLSSYPILCAHFQPVYTWDDMWLYLSLVLAMQCQFKNRPLLAAAVFSVGVVARTVIMLVYPAFLIGILCMNDMRLNKRILAAAIPVFVLGAYLLIVYHDPAPGRFQIFNTNFADAASAKNSIFSLLISFGFMWPVSLASAAVLGHRLLSDRIRKVVLLGAAISIPLVVVSSMTMALARETRLFYPPFLFIIPLTLWLVQDYWPKIRDFYGRFFGLPGFALLAIYFWGGITFARILFPSFNFRAGPELAQLLFGINIALALAVLTPIVVSVIVSSSNAVDASATD